MEAFAYFLLKSVIWLSAFALIYVLFLRNERFFLLNRFYLLAGIIASLLFPFISIHYTVILPVPENIGLGNIPITRIENAETSTFISFSFLMIVIYNAGALFVAYKVFKQSRTVIRVIKKADITTLLSVKLIRTAEYTSSFSFFSYVFVNPSVTDIETAEIVNHEMAHIRQWHWVDLVLFELLCLLQWFNPVVWIYIRFIRQNHEYLADEVALQRTSDPAVYRAALLNQIVGAPVIILANSFNYSINKKRFNMMKNKLSSPYRKMKVLLVLPVIAVVLYSFAKPEYKYISNNESNGIAATISTQAAKEVKGTVVDPSGKPLTGAAVVLKGTTSGVTSDSRGFFRLADVPEDGMLIVSYVGFKTKVVKPVFTAEMNLKMESDTMTLKSIGVPPPPPPPPPPSQKAIRQGAGAGAPPPPPPLQHKYLDGTTPLYVVDGKLVSESEFNLIDVGAIESIDITKSKSVVSLYGGTDNERVVRITSKRNAGESGGRVAISNSDGSKANPLFVIDGVIDEDFETSQLDPNSISSMSVFKDQKAIDLYGVKGKDGVVVITTKDKGTGTIKGISEVRVTGYAEGPKTDKDAYVVMEEMPAFPGGEKALQSYIYSNIKVVKGSEKISEPVLVVFTVDSKGKVRDAKVLKKKYPVWEAEAIRVVSSMPDWKPGMQNGKPIDVILQLPIDFGTVR